MKQMPQPSFQQISREALVKARQLGHVEYVTEAVNRAAMLIAMSPELVEQQFKAVMEKGEKL